MRRDCILIESAAERWMNKLVGQYISNSTDQKTLTATVGSTTYTLKFENNAIVGTLPNEENIKFYTESVTEITFELLKNDSELLLICTVTCKYQEGENPEEFKICVNPHVGDTYQPT